MEGYRNGIFLEHKHECLSGKINFLIFASLAKLAILPFLL